MPRSNRFSRLPGEPSYAEIGKALGMSPAVVHKLMMRALYKLRLKQVTANRFRDAVRDHRRLQDSKLQTLTDWDAEGV